MNKIVILEGPDGGGKTTLARYLEQHHGFKYIHTGPPRGEDLLEEYGYQLWRATYDSQPVVFDRLYLGERIYGPVLRGYDGLGEYGFKLMRRLTKGQGVYEVICLPPYETCFANWQKSHSDIVKNSHKFVEIYERYQTYLRTPGFGVWDYTNIDLRLAGDIVQSGLTEFSSLPPDTVGSPTASFFFVGDKANERRLDLPFFASGGGNSSEFFNDCLAQAGYSEQEITLSNAYRLDKSVRTFSNIPPKVQVIALGQRAAAVLQQQRVEYVQAFHPAYWKRFHYHHTAPYIEQLASIRIRYYQEKQRVGTTPYPIDSVS